MHAIEVQIHTQWRERIIWLFRDAGMQGLEHIGKFWKENIFQFHKTMNILPLVSHNQFFFLYSNFINQLVIQNAIRFLWWSETLWGVTKNTAKSMVLQPTSILMSEIVKYSLIWIYELIGFHIDLIFGELIVNEFLHLLC